MPGHSLGLDLRLCSEWASRRPRSGPGVCTAPPSRGPQGAQALRDARGRRARAAKAFRSPAPAPNLPAETPDSRMRNPPSVSGPWVTESEAALSWRPQTARARGPSRIRASTAWPGPHPEASPRTSASGPERHRAPRKPEGRHGAARTRPGPQPPAPEASTDQTPPSAPCQVPEEDKSSPRRHRLLCAPEHPAEAGLCSEGRDQGVGPPDARGSRAAPPRQAPVPEELGRTSPHSVSGPAKVTRAFRAEPPPGTAVPGVGVRRQAPHGCAADR